MKKPAPDPKTCASCAFFTPERLGENVGECRRYPPSPIAAGEDVISVSPQMGMNDWCGEYQRKTH